MQSPILADDQLTASQSSPIIPIRARAAYGNAGSDLSTEHPSSMTKLQSRSVFGRSVGIKRAVHDSRSTAPPHQRTRS